MVLHPEVQERVHEELDSVAEGRDHVTMEDRARLPYVEATLNEIWRYCNVAPFGPPRRGRSLFLNRTLKRLSHEIWRHNEALDNFYFASIGSLDSAKLPMFFEEDDIYFLYLKNEEVSEESETSSCNHACQGFFPTLRLVHCSLMLTLPFPRIVVILRGRHLWFLNLNLNFFIIQWEKSSKWATTWSPLQSHVILPFILPSFILRGRHLGC